MERETKEQKAIKYLKKKGFGNTAAWWDNSRIYYNLTAKEIVNVCNYLNKY